ncbi:hypothetical protein F383_24822 [Gossypium arboreum]|uniref:Uncharacterized protein n=1 Tax=Gossypium arboreum TaxID=29729 RepID=A0A0B0P5X3_GOSAR|nr:hypothetical protein F383_24822 [Gossypium arboreum]
MMYETHVLVSEYWYRIFYRWLVRDFVVFDSIPSVQKEVQREVQWFIQLARVGDRQRFYHTIKLSFGV